MQMMFVYPLTPMLWSMETLRAWIISIMPSTRSIFPLRSGSDLEFANSAKQTVTMSRPEPSARNTS